MLSRRLKVFTIYSFSVLLQLGEDLPHNPSYEEFDVQSDNIIKVLSRPTMTDKKKAAAMKILAQLQIITMFVSPRRHPFLILRMLQLTISHGTSPTDPTIHSFYSSPEYRFSHKISCEHHFVDRAFNRNSNRSGVFCIVAGQTRSD
jgi:hypothetical protein